MNYKIQLRESAIIEVEQTLQYYLEISPQTAFNFNEDLEVGFSTLINNPFFETKIKDFRVFPLSKFPFLIIFSIIEDEKIIDILSVFHTAQNPEKYPS